MRFYVPEWDDAVDAHYDFEHDELSVLDRQEREVNYIWDIFDREALPIDGVLISREQVETSQRKFDRLTTHGIYDDGVLSVPEWLPTISDCGAWGYKSLPFPPYGNAEMLDFYEDLDVTIGVTIDHLVLGSGKDMGRLYLDERAFGEVMERSDVPDTLTDVLDLMVDEWPDEWPPYVDEYDSSVRTGPNESVEPFTLADFDGDVETVLSRLESDPRAVYQEDDKQFRYDLTLRNAREMANLYEQGEYPFRLMVAIQGWDPESYRSATADVLELGYDYIGIGGVAGSPIHEVRKIVTSVGKTIKAFERDHGTRVDSHVFGFAKTDAFETIGRSGIASFDSASMLRSAWTGGENYQLDTEERYDAIRVRYPSPGDDLPVAVEKSLRGRETLVALRAYAAEDSITDALTAWAQRAGDVIPNTRRFLREHRHDDRFDASRLRDIESALREELDVARELQASFSEDLRGELVKLLREDSADEPLAFDEYDTLLQTAERQFEAFPRMLAPLEAIDSSKPLEQVWTVVREYAEWVGDEDLLDAYYETLSARPWELCDCRICGRDDEIEEGHGVEVCIFRGNDRNRRRGFHNTKRFYDQFAEELPKILVTTRGTAGLGRYDTVESYLSSEHPQFWTQVHDLPVAEVGVLDASGVREWWTKTPTSISFAPNRLAENLASQTDRYQQLFVHAPDRGLSEETRTAVEATGCDVTEFEDPNEIRETVLETCGENYTVGSDFLPHPPEVETRDGLDVLIIDQCSGSKNFPEASPVFDAVETLEHSREELLRRTNVPAIAARDLYAGRQQEYISNAVRQLRRSHNVDRYFISAGFGLVAEDEPLPPYEVTFSSMNVTEIRDRSERLHIQRDVQRLLRNSTYNVVFFALGKDYYTSVDIDEMVQEVPADRIGVVFNRELVDEQFDNIVSVPARTEDAKNHGTIVIGLKGRYLEHFARRIDSVTTLKPALIEDLCRRVENEPTQTGFELDVEPDSNLEKESSVEVPDEVSDVPNSDEQNDSGGGERESSPQAVYDALVHLSDLTAPSSRGLEFDDIKPLLNAFGIDETAVSQHRNRSYLVRPTGPGGREFAILCGQVTPEDEVTNGPVRAHKTGLTFLADIAADEGRFAELDNPTILSIESDQLAIYSEDYKRVIYFHEGSGEWDQGPRQTPLTMDAATELFKLFRPASEAVSQTQLESF